MAENSGRSGGRAQAAESRRHWQYDLTGSKSLIGCRRLLQLALLAMLLLATGQGAWVKVGAYDTPGYASGVAVSGSYAYVADDLSGLQVIDVSNPDSPSIVGTCDTPGSALDVAVSGSYAYVADHVSGLQIIDVSNPDSPSIVGSCYTPGGAWGMAVSGDYAYVADWNSGLQIIDVSDPASPNIVGSCDTPGDARGVALSDGYAYVADGGWGLRIIDVGNPAGPTIVGGYYTGYFISDVALSGGRVYASDYVRGLMIFDVSNPASPSIVGTCDTPGDAYGVAVSDGYAYVADWSSGLQIIDIINPASPSIVGTCDTPGDAHDVAVSDGYAYVADGYKGLQIIEGGATLRGKAWRDLNGDGLQDAGELGLANVAVQILDGSANPIVGKSTTTGSDGRYTFPDLVPGDYYVQFTSLGKIFSPKDQGDDSLDSDVDFQGRSDKITLAPRQSKSLDAGVYENQIIINEIYPNPVGEDNQPSAGVAGWERAELKNVGTADCNIGQWTIKDDDNPFILATIPAGTIIPAGGYLVVHIKGSSGGGISNGDGDPVILCNFAGVEMNRVACPASSSKQGLSYSCIPDASTNWNFWGGPTFGGSLSAENLPGAPNMVQEDYGDAPDSYNTLRASDGARHLVTGPYLGSSVDYEPDGQPGPNADGDGADEDGATFSANIIAGLPSTFTVTASAPGILQAWMDFNADGIFGAGEQIAINKALSAGLQTIDFSVPADARAGYTYARLRFSSASGLASYGLASDGEVEDYRVEIKYVLGDFVWEDKDGDGLQDDGEPGMPGVTVNLKDAADAVVSTQTTLADGKYLFINPTPGICTLEFLLPGYGITRQDAGPDDTKDSDAHPADHRAGPVTVVQGQSDLSWDAGFYHPVSISGMKFHDKNANGLREVDEPPISGWDIQLKDSSDKLLQTVTTSSEPGKEGIYEFVDLQPGSYRVYEVSKTGWVRTVPAEEYYPITLTTSNSQGKLFGNNQLAISGTKFHDRNANGLREADEPPLSGWDIQLKDSGDQILQTVTTSSEPGKEGIYEFVDLQPGSYRVYEVSKTGWVRTAPATEYHAITLTNMPSRGNLFGNNQLAISGTKFHDRNANSLREADEPPLSGWDIQLKDSGDQILQTATTSSEPGKEGIYEFVDLQQGTYKVSEIQKPGWARTFPEDTNHVVTLDKMGADSINFGNVIAAGFSGMKFEDSNGNGAKDSGEPGLSGWTIKLMKEGTEVARRETAADGTYSFAGIAPGSYTVKEVIPDGWTQSYPGSPDTHPVTLVSGIAGPTDIDFGNYRSTGFSGMKFEDLNGNGAKDSGEPGLASWTIKLMKEGTEVARRETAADGTYSFADIAPGSYTVEEVAQAGWTQSYPASPGTQAVTLVSGVAGPTDINLGNLRTTVFSGMKFEDLNGNGAKDIGEPGLAGWTIKLKKEGTQVASRETASDGTYSFAGIAPGSYTVEEVAQAGWTQSYPSSPGTQAVTLVSGVAGPTDINFGNYHSTSFSGMKFEDSNGNGARDSGELGLAGWTIKLKKDGTQVASRETTADGTYSFTGIVAGSYTVEEAVQDGWIQTYPATPGTHTLDLASSVAGPNDIDFGNFRSTGLAGIKFEDRNGNGVRDTDEPGLAGWTIKLMKDGTDVASTQTAADGTYSFADIAPGSYTVEEEAKDGWIQTSPAGNVYTAVSSSGKVTITRADQSEVAATEVNFGNRKLVEAFQVLMTANPQTGQPGQKIVFTITINRLGDILLNSLGAEYTLPKGLKFVSSNPSPESVIENADGTTTLIWTGLSFGAQIAAQTAEDQSPSTAITVTSQIQPGTPQSLTSTVVVTGSASEATIAEARAEVTVKVQDQNLKPPISLNKTSDLKEVWPGGTVAYTITYENQYIDLTDVVITEQASSDLIFLSATPAPDLGTDNVWSIGQLPSQGKGTINVLFQVKNASNLSFDSQSSVSGNGFVNSYRRLSTETQSGGLKNSVTLTCYEFTPVSTSYFVKLRDSQGTSLLKKEHVSGEYRSEEMAALQMQNRSIRSEGSLKAVYRPTSFSLPGDKSINYDSEISSLTQTRNRATQASTSQEFRYARSLEMDQQLLLDKNETIMAVEAELQGQAHLGMLKKESTAVKPSPIFESSQDYIGSFRFNQSLQDYGGNVRLIRNATGQGQAASDQRLKKSQRSYEHGSGSYESEELASTAESYMARDLSVSHDPQYGYGKWKAGIWSRSSGTSYLGQEISGADYIREETKAAGLSDMSTNLSFQGKARLRAVSKNAQNEVDLDEEYVGQYALQRSVHLGGVSRFDRPHLTLNKTGRLVPGTATADYTITVLNDGNAALGPVYVWDIFPAGTDYLNSSLKPDRLQPGYANWSLLYLSIGQFVNIKLRLNVTDPQEELVNVVYASGGHNGEWVTAGNMSVMQFGWLSCCLPKMLVEKQARIDSADNSLIWYRILLKNQANVSLVAQVKDLLPTGLQLLNASAEPQVQGQNLAWVTTAIPAGESRFIEYLARATQNGKFVNTARIEAHALDGSGGASAAASATVTIGEATSYAEDGWRPPAWGLDRSEKICDEGIAGEGASCSCPLEGD